MDSPPSQTVYGSGNSYGQGTDPEPWGKRKLTHYVLQRSRRTRCHPVSSIWMERDCSRPLRKHGDGFCGGEGHGGREGPVSIAPSGGSPSGASGLRPPGAAKVEGGRCGRAQRLLPENGPRRPQAVPGGEPAELRPGDPRQRPRRQGGKAEALRGSRRRRQR